MGRMEALEKEGEKWQPALEICWPPTHFQHTHARTCAHTHTHTLTLLFYVPHLWAEIHGPVFSIIHLSSPSVSLNPV